MGTITSASASIVISIPGVLPSDVPLFGFAADDAFMADSFDVAETRMGVDGILSAGFTPSPKPFKVTFQPDSPSIAVFDLWVTTEESNKEKFQATMVVALPTLSKKYEFNVGWLKNAKKLPDAKKVLEPQTYEIHWQPL
jgi:hypothetical protein